MPSAVVMNAVLVGIGLSILLGVFVLGSLRLDATMWVHSYPPDIRARFGPTPPQARRRRALLALVVYACVAAILWLAIRRLPTLPGGELTPSQIFVTAWVVFNVLNLVDLLIIDWFILLTLKPRWMILPGTDATMAGYHNYAYPFRGFLIGLVITALASTVVTGIALLVTRLTS
jgi:hypothetical protein